MRKRVVILICVLASCLVSMAQQLEVSEFYADPSMYDAVKFPKNDLNGERCGLVKVGLASPDVVFEGNVVYKELKYGEWWVYLMSGSRWLTIKTRSFVPLRYEFPNPIQSNITYVMTVVTGDEPLPTHQYLVFQISPANATLFVNDEIWELEPDGSAKKFVKFGSYDYRVEAPKYHSVTGVASVNDSEHATVVTKDLSPNFGWIEVLGTGNLQGANVYIDNILVGRAPFKSEALKSGFYTVRISKRMYEAYNEKVAVNDGEITRLSPTLGANFAEVTLDVDADAEIWVNNEKKGFRTWTGPLANGIYKIECRQPNHEASQITKEITADMDGQHITLPAPRPIYGSLNVESSPSFCKLFIDGTEVGQTPVRINAILIGMHTLRIEKEGCAPLVKTIMIEEDKTLKLDEKLDTGRSLIVKTDRKGDKIYVDGDLVGETPHETSVGFGPHTINVERNGVMVEKTIDIKESTSNGQELFFEFGRLITIYTDLPGDVVTVDGVELGVSPVTVDLPIGTHSVHAQRGKKYADKDIEVLKEGGETEPFLSLHGETVSHYVQNGVNFVTLNAAYNFTTVPSFGFCVGSVKKFGWFVTAMSNFQFKALGYTQIADDQALVDGSMPNYVDEVYYTRVSAMAGALMRVGSLVCIRLGVGYGMITMSQNTSTGDLVKLSRYSYTGVDATAGVQLDLKGFTISADVVTTNFQTIEAKLGLGYCWKRK